MVSASGGSARRLGELLLQQHLLTQTQLEQALAEQRVTKEFLGEILVRRRFVQPQALLEALSEQSGIPAEPLPLERVDWKIVKQFPPSVLSDGRCFPIRADEESVTVAIANPLDAWTVSAVEKAAGFRAVKTVLVLPHELSRVIQAYRQRVLQAIETQLGRHPNDQTK